MNIKQSKKEIENAIKAYLAKDEFGEYKIPVTRQRPILLIGPPGIGKTAIMEQVARENEIGLISYTITHHTRQSAIGLPFIDKRKYGGQEYSITEYTMSEIIASVYKKVESTGLKEGILFIDEINCVSETLAPTMLQFLQCKTFGNHRIPEGWIIVAAGNPPEYNKSVREFDIVTLDRVKKILVEEDYTVWKEYAYKNSINVAIISYLDIKKEDFYIIETTIDGKEFVTARGWEDLSEVLSVYEELNIAINEELIYQYLQHKRVAKSFANYLDLYNKYKFDYKIDDIINGEISAEALEKIKVAPFDEKLSILNLILSKIGEYIKNANSKDSLVTSIFNILKDLKKIMLSKSNSTKSAEEIFGMLIKSQYNSLKAKKSSSLIDKQEENKLRNIIKILENYNKLLKEQGIYDKGEAFEYIKSLFNKEIKERKIAIKIGSDALNNGFVFIENAFGESQEMVVFITELTINYHSAKFISENGCAKYFEHNKELLFNEKEKDILRDIGEIEEALNFEENHC